MERNQANDQVAINYLKNALSVVAIDNDKAFFVHSEPTDLYTIRLMRLANLNVIAEKVMLSEVCQNSHAIRLNANKILNACQRSSHV